MLEDIKEHCDFTCWVIKYGTKSINGKIYRKDAIRCENAAIVPLCWAHDHTDASAALGYALIEGRDEGIYMYGKLTEDLTKKNIVNDLIHTKGSVSVSPFITQVKFDGDYIVNGIIREVSLVSARVDPDEAYYPVPKGEKV